MNAAGSIKRSILGASVALVVVFGGVSQASALSPWWHLTSGARPADIQPGTAKDEVQEVSVSGTEGRFVLASSSELAFFEWDATHEEVQQGLEGIYGKGNVSVAGGPGDETGSKPYVITFIGELAGRSVERMSGQASN